MADKTVMLQLDISSDASDAVRAADDVAAAYGDVERAMDKAASGADAAESKLSGVAEGADATASASAQAAGGLGDLGGALQLLPGPAAKVGIAMEAAAPAIMGVTGAADLANFATEKLRLGTIKAGIATAAKTAKDRVAAVATKAWAAAQFALNAVMSANPLALVVLAVVALIAVVVIAYKRSEKFRAIVDKAFKAVKSVVLGVVRAVVGFVRDNWKKLLVLLTGPFGLAFVVIRRYGGRIRDTVVDAFNRVRAFVVDVGSRIWSAVRGAWERVGSTVRSAAGKVKDAAIGGFRAVIDWLRDFPGNLSDLVGRAFTAARDKAAAALDRLWSAVRDKVNRVVSFVRELPGRLTGALGNVGTLLYDIGTDIIQGLLDGIESMIGKVKDKLSGVTDLIPDWKGPRERDRKLLRPAGQLIMDGLMAGFDDRRSRVRDQLRRLTADVRASVQAATADPVQLQLGGGLTAGSVSRQPSRVAYITIQGAIDPVSTAKQVRKLLQQDASWHGQVLVTP